MRTVRYILQIAIVLFGGSVLTALAISPQFNLWGFLGLAAFFGFLLLATLLLREHTESRLIYGRQLNPKIFGAFLLFIAGASCWLSVSIANGYSGTSSRRGVILRLSIELLGPWPATVFFGMVGLYLLGLAYHLFRRG